MKINIIGGGPAGLYFAILMKKANPSHEISVFERNASDATFGWGVVFSDKTLGYLQDNDVPTHQSIVQNFQTWDNVDVVHRGQKITIRGNKFTGIARIRLLNILQARCAELGVLPRYGHDIADPSTLADADLLVGADGINSLVRTRYAESFHPELDARPNRYIWFGTKRLFHGLTLTFRESDAGVFAAHSYKFSRDYSTFIVECDPDTWKNAGFGERSDDDTRAYLEQVFADDLDGRSLESNNSKWIRFLLVKNGQWHHENVVLLGDALHTAHFSIGSGTKLALEDAIALAKSFHGAPSVREALVRFESGRRPIVEALQDAAQVSMEWFEHARDAMHLTPLELAYALMTRSGRIDHEKLRRRDPDFIAAYERAAAETT